MFRRGARSVGGASEGRSGHKEVRVRPIQMIRHQGRPALVLTFSRPGLRDKKLEDVERVGDGVSSQQAVASDDGAGEDRDADVEDAREAARARSHQLCFVQGGINLCRRQ